MISQERLFSLITRIYDAAADPSLWPTFLENLGDAIHGTTTAIVYHDLKESRATRGFQIRFDPDYVRRYTEYYCTFDPWREAWLARFNTASAQGIVASGQLVDLRRLERTEFYNDYLSPQETVHQVGGPIVMSGDYCAIITCLRPEAGGPFNPEEVHLVRLLFPHLQRAMEFHRKMAELDGRHLASLDALDALPTGVILLDQRGRILQVNRAAQQLLNQNDGLTSGKEGLVAATPELTKKLRARIASATLRVQENLAADPLRIDRPSGKRPFVLITMEVSILAFTPMAKRPSAIVFVSDPEIIPQTTPETLAGLYGLTVAESRVAEKLSQGLPLTEAAEQLEISHNTARTHLQKIYQKSGTRHQGELVRLLVTSSVSRAKKL